MHVLAEQRAVRCTTVAEHLRRANVNLRRPGLDAMQIDQGRRALSPGLVMPATLGECFGCGAETVRQELKRRGVQMRAPRERGPS